MRMAATSFVGKMTPATGGPMSLNRVSVSCSQTVPNRENQTKSSVLIALVAQNEELNNDTLVSGQIDSDIIFL